MFLVDEMALDFGGEDPRDRHSQICRGRSRESLAYLFISTTIAQRYRFTRRSLRSKDLPVRAAKRRAISCVHTCFEKMCFIPSNINIFLQILYISITYVAYHSFLRRYVRREFPFIKTKLKKCIFWFSITRHVRAQDYPRT